jgi:hypothetical protein
MQNSDLATPLPNPPHSVNAEAHRTFVEAFAARQLQIYELQPQELVGHFNREESVISSYRGRQILELLQNADDAGANYTGESRILLRLTEEFLLVANTGESFSPGGFESLFISDNSPKQLHRSQCIGHKGLGFRSVLSWTSEPLVLSGRSAVAFSAKIAVGHASKLADRLPWLRKTFDNWTASEGRLPVPTMRFPFLPGPENPWRTTAESIQQRGYDTVVVLPLLSGKYQEVLAQLHELSGETALFCRHLSRLTIETPELNETWDVERDPERNGTQPTIITHGKEQRLWVVHRRTGCVTDDVLDERLRKTPSYEVAVAVPEEIAPGTNHKLCVFFPTADRLPMPMLAHATLDTDDNRKRLTDHAANREVLGHLANLIAEVAEIEATKSSPSRAFELLAGIERCDDELREFGFLDEVLEACSERKIFPRLDGRLSVADDVRSTSKSIWRSVADLSVFPEMFALEPSATTNEFIAAVGIDNYTDEELSRGLETLANQMPPATAAHVIGMLLVNSAMPRNPLPSVLRDELGTPIPADTTTFLPPENQLISLPSWARGQISVLHPDFAHALRTALSVSTVRDLRSNLYVAGYDFEEFRFETLARRLEEIATEEAATSLDLQRSRCRDVLRCLFDLARADKDLGVIKTPVRIITTRGGLHRADECYFGPDYDDHRLAHDLYHAFGQDEFVSSVNDLGLTDTPIGQVVVFLKRLGVSDQPRLKRIASHEFSKNRLTGLEEMALADCADLSAAFGSTVHKPADVYRLFYGIKIDGIKLPDRFVDVLRQHDVAPLIAFLAGPGAVLLMSDYALDAEFTAKPSPRHYHRSYPVRIPNPVTFILRREAWVPCGDRKRRSPNQIILHRLGSIILEGTFFTHAIALGGNSSSRSEADSVLLRLGAITSLESLQPHDMYRLLAELPTRDPEGKNAPGIYRSLLEQGVRIDDTGERQLFLASGKMWGYCDNRADYYPVTQLRYVARRSLPAPVKKLIPLVDIDRRKAADVERIFGIQQVRPSDVVLAVDKETIEVRPWSFLVGERLAQALPFLYACRLARTNDLDGREVRRLSGVSICVCASFRASVTVEGVARDDVLFETELDGVVVGQMLFLVSNRSEFPRSNQSFWRGVGDLLSEVVDAAVGGDFASILACESPDDIRDLLDQISEGRAESLIAQAQSRWAMDLSKTPVNEVLPLPPPSPEPPAPVHEPALPATEASLHPKQSDPLLEAQIFQQTPAPPERTSEKLRFSAGTPTSRGGKRMVQITSEVETLAIAAHYEKLDGRFTIAANHIHGYAGPRCDLLSVDSEEIRNVALRTHAISLENVVRFIEVKGRNQRTGAVELTENELLGAEKYRDRYFIYRVFCDSTDPASRELAVLCDPMNSPGHKITRTARFSFHETSGAKWFELVAG